MSQDEIQVSGVVLNTLLVLSGWLFIYVNTNRISKRSEIRGIVDKAVSITREINDKGIAAWENEVANKSRVTLSLVRSVEDIEKYAEMLKNSGFMEEIIPKIKELRRSVTYDYKGQNVSNQRGYMIWQSAQDVVFSFEDYFVRSYH